jgi:plasmid replication initiation protein
MKRATASKITISSETSLANRNVSMSNTIVSAAHALNLSEKRIVSAALAKLDSISKKAPSRPIRITALEFSECFGIDETTAYEQLHAGSKSLYRRSIRRVFETPFGQKVEEIRWIDRALYHRGEGFVELNFTSHVSPYLMALEKRFTTYKLAQAKALRSIHSWRLFENLKRWESTGKWIVEIDDFHHAMDASPSYRANFAQLRKWVIEPAVRELKEVSGLDITWTWHKTGRKVSRLVFLFEPAAQMTMDFAPPAEAS